MGKVGGADEVMERPRRSPKGSSMGAAGVADVGADVAGTVRDGAETSLMRRESVAEDADDPPSTLRAREER